VRDEHGSGLDQDWSQFWPDQDWIGLEYFWKLAEQDWIGPRKFFWLFWKYQKLSDFTSLLNGSVYFAIKFKNSAGNILQFQLHSLCSLHIWHWVLVASCNVNIVVWMVSVNAFCAIVRWFCSHHFLLVSL